MHRMESLHTEICMYNTYNLDFFVKFTLIEFKVEIENWSFLALLFS